MRKNLSLSIWGLVTGLRVPRPARPEQRRSKQERASGRQRFCGPPASGIQAYHTPGKRDQYACRNVTVAFRYAAEGPAKKGALGPSWDLQSRQCSAKHLWPEQATPPAAASGCGPVFSGKRPPNRSLSFHLEAEADEFWRLSAKRRTRSGRDWHGMLAAAKGLPFTSANSSPKSARQLGVQSPEPTRHLESALTGHRARSRLHRVARSRCAISFRSTCGPSRS